MQVTRQEWDAYELQEQNRLRALVVAAKHSTRANARLDTQDEQLRDMNVWKGQADTSSPYRSS